MLFSYIFFSSFQNLRDMQLPDISFGITPPFQTQTDPFRPVSLFAHHHPSDHKKVVVQGILILLTCVYSVTDDYNNGI